MFFGFLLVPLASVKTDRRSSGADIPPVSFRLQVEQASRLWPSAFSSAVAMAKENTPSLPPCPAKNIALRYFTISHIPPHGERSAFAIVPTSTPAAGSIAQSRV